MYLVTMLTAATVSYIIGSVVINRIMLTKFILTYGYPLILVLTFFFAVKDKVVYSKGAICITLLLGMNIGHLFCICRFGHVRKADRARPQKKSYVSYGTKEE